MTDREIIETVTLVEVTRGFDNALHFAEHGDLTNRLRTLARVLEAVAPREEVEARSIALREHIKTLDKEECDRLLGVIGESYHRWKLAHRLVKLEKGEVTK